MRVLPVAPAIALGMALAGCGGDGSPGAALTPTPGDSAAPAPATARADLAARAAAAQDLVGVSAYTLVTPEREDHRTVLVVRAEDGGWRVDIPGGALGGTVDVSIVTTAGGGLHHCALSRTRGAAPTPTRRPDPEPDPEGQAEEPDEQAQDSDEQGEPAALQTGCVAVDELRPAADPQVQHVFTDWLEVLMDRSAPLAVTAEPAPDGVNGDCFQVEPSTASLVEPLDGGVYCFAPDGELTGARLGLGDLTLTSDNDTAPASVELPARVVDREPVPVASPTPAPTGTPSER